MSEAEILNEVTLPSGWELASMTIGIIGSLITVVSVIVTIQSMRQTRRYKAEAEQASEDAYLYKTQAENQLRCLDMYAYAESFTRVIHEIVSTPSRDKNNKAGKLNLLFDHLDAVIGELTKYTTLLSDTDEKKAIETKKSEITKYIIEHRVDETVDIASLCDMFTETERLLRKEINDYQERLKRG